MIKDESVYEKMTTHMQLNTMGVSRDTQLRVSKLLNTIIESKGREIFEFGHNVMKSRWEKLNKVVSLSDRFSLQKIPPEYCNYFKSVRDSSPGMSICFRTKFNLMNLKF